MCRRTVLGIVVTLAFATLSANVPAMTLAEAFEAARAFDPQFRAAAFELDSSRLGVPIARAGLLPQVSLNISTSAVTGNRQFPNSTLQEVTTRVDYTAPQTSLSIRQPLFNYESLSRYRQAEAQTEVAESNYRARGLELVDRLSTAYIQALLAVTALELAQSEVVLLNAQVARAEQRMLRGEGTRTEQAQARAGLEQSRYRVIDATDQLAFAKNRLRRITGQEAGWVRGLSADFRPAPLVPGGLQEWIGLATDQNPTLESRLKTVTVARANVQRNIAGHLPRVDLVASSSKSRNDSIANLNQTNNLTSLGVQISIPLFSGGGVSASVRQSEADQARAEQDARSERENLELEVQRLYMAVSNGVPRIDAQRNVVSANETALLGLTRAQETGLATAVDVLDARSRLFTANRDLVQVRYEYLASRMRLMVVSGMPMQHVIDDLDQFLAVRTDLQPRDTP